MLEVHDVLGRTVKVLANAEFAPGFYEFEWSPSQHEMRGAGLYTCKLSVVGAERTVSLSQKIIVNK
jgi:hypothetical protein